MVDSIIQGDCLEVMTDIEDKSIDMILCDLPYGMLEFEWDTKISLDLLWQHYKRIIKDDGAVVLTGSQPFTSELVMSNKEWFRHEWIWVKSVASNFCHLKYNPFKEHENIVVFSKNGVKFNPIRQPKSAFTQLRDRYPRKQSRSTKGNHALKDIRSLNQGELISNILDRHPASVQYFSRDKGYGNKYHPSQKPVALFEYLIKTYTNEGDLVLDNCAGSCTTAVACKRLNRRYICIEKEQGYCDIGQARVDDVDAEINSQPTLFEKVAD